MSKVFLYMYPIEEYTRSFFATKGFYAKGESPYEVLNKCIEKRYRNKGYTVVWGLYSDKKAYGVNVKQDVDEIIHTDVSFSEASIYNKKGTLKNEEEIERLNEALLIRQLGEDVDKLVIGGYFSTDDVNKIAKAAEDAGIDTMVDLDLTEYFVDLYKQKKFNIEEYNPEIFKELLVKRAKEKRRQWKDLDDYILWKKGIENEIYRLFPNSFYGLKRRNNLNDLKINESNVLYECER